LWHKSFAFNISQPMWRNWMLLKKAMFAALMAVVLISTSACGGGNATATARPSATPGPTSEPTEMVTEQATEMATTDMTEAANVEETPTEAATAEATP
jgi:hypothetical protein